MKKITSTFVVGILVLSGLGAVALSESEDKIVEKTESVFFSAPIIRDEGEYVSLSLEDSDLYLRESGNPMMPMYVKVMELPFGVKNVKVTCEPHEISEQLVPKEIAPTPPAAPLIIDGEKMISEPVKNQEVYSSKNPYPSEWYSYRVGCGLNSEGEHVTHAAIQIYPVRYVPAEGKLYVAESADITITYEEPESNPFPTTSKYDLVIIAPRRFLFNLIPLVRHKKDHNVSTILKTTEWIYRNYEGRDKPEQIKYFIKDAIEEWGVKYVLLFGGLKYYINAYDRDDHSQGSTDWHVPVRYMNIQAFDEPGCISDLYYGDVYKYNASSGEYEFEDWDSNGDGIFAGWRYGLGRDVLDLYPDVYVGRLACRNLFEVMIMVTKIIYYEKEPANPEWFTKMVVVAGKTFELYEGQPDGEFVCDTAIGYMGDLVETPVKVYASNRDTAGYVPVPEDIAAAISRGAGYVNFQGHGNPVRWDTIWADGSYPADWCGGASLYGFVRYLNGRKLPVVVVGGCHNALFNVSIYKTLHSTEFGNDHWYWTHNLPAPACFSWGLCIVPYGGAIASTGCTGYGIGYVGQPISLSAELESNFFHQIGAKNGDATPGYAHSGAITRFIHHNNPIGQTDAFCITEFQFFGDPSLKLGGYSQ